MIQDGNMEDLKCLKLVDDYHEPVAACSVKKPKRKSDSAIKSALDIDGNEPLEHEVDDNDYKRAASYQVPIFILLYCACCFFVFLKQVDVDLLFRDCIFLCPSNFVFF